MNVVVCGSLAYPELLRQAAAAYPADNVVVPVADGERSAAEYDALWLVLILLADLVVVVRKPDGSLGVSAAREVAWAVEHGVPVRWWPTS